MFDDTYELVCDERDARILLENAKKSCPGAVEVIEAAVKQRRSPGAAEPTLFHKR
jgi:hypothetical protein